ncbi:MAG: flavodoxin [Erysipelotrichaceae bacterium]|nr:flavodoxin [Erysipelotrichaceae bacterium]
MKKRISILFAILLILCLSACSAGKKTESADGSSVDGSDHSQDDNTDSSASQDAETEGKVLVVYFSATGTTKGVAEKIAKLTGADLYEIVPAEPYSDADLNWNDSKSRTTKEQNDKTVRPEIAGEKVDLSAYRTVYIGFPIWWGEEPRIMDTFAESYEFDGITLVPFCTSSSSGIGRSGKNMEALSGSGTWLEGRRFAGSVSEADLQAWIDGLN